MTVGTFEKSAPRVGAKRRGPGRVAAFSVLQIGSWLLAYIYLADPSEPVVLIASVLPPFGPILAAMRIPDNDVPAWQIVLALVFIVTVVVGGIVLAGRVRANSTTRIGARLRFMDAFRV